MPDRHTRNVSLTSHEERFVQAQLASGRYRTASEVVRDGIRLLEAREHEQRLEQWLYGEVGDETLADLPPSLVDKARDAVRALVAEAEADLREHRTRDAGKVIKKLRQRINAKPAE